jgi:hypothetical protein
VLDILPAAHDARRIPANVAPARRCSPETRVKIIYGVLAYPFTTQSPPEPFRSAAAEVAS